MAASRLLGVRVGACCLLLLAPAGPLADSGYERFVKRQAGLAKKAARKGDHLAAEAAWAAVLELDPNAIEAMLGVAAAARARKEADAEILALTNLVQTVEAEAEPSRSLAKEADRARKRLAALDPQDGEAAALLAAYSLSQAELGAAYLEQGHFGSAWQAWGGRLRSVRPGSPEQEQARAARARILREGGDDVASSGLEPGALAAGRDEAWIAKHDKRTAKWGQAARWETPHYRIKTNAGWRLGSAAAAVMERVHAFYREVWGIVPDPPPKKPDPSLRNLSITPIEVDIFATRKEYSRKSGGPEWSGGLYNGSAVMTFHEAGGGASLRSMFRTLFHEASHQFMREAVGSAPSFVNEGIACLFEGIELLSNGSIRRDNPVEHYLKPLAKKLKAGTALPLREVTGGKDAHKNEPEFYKYRWGVMFFLRMYVDEQGQYVYRDRLTDYIYSFKRGAPGDMVKHFTEFFITGEEAPEVAGIASFDDFEALWRQWMLKTALELTEEDKRLDEYRGQGRLAGLKKDWPTSLRFYEKALDIDPDDLDSLFGAAAACQELERANRAVVLLRRFRSLAAEGDKRRQKAATQLFALDPHDEDFIAARRSFAGGMAALARRYDKADMPRMAMWCGRQVLDLDPYEPSARALVDRIERETGLSTVRWRRLFNGFDLDGWYSPSGGEAFFAQDGQLVSDSSKVAEELEADAGSSLYRVLFVDRTITGDWSLEGVLRAEPGWQIAGLCFGGKGSDNYEAIVLRNKGTGGPNNVDFGSFAGGWSFRGDGSVLAEYDPTRPEGTRLRIDVRGRKVTVHVDGQLVKPVVGGRSVGAMQYPLAALRGDIGLLGSAGVTRYSGLRLLAR